MTLFRFQQAGIHRSAGILYDGIGGCGRFGYVGRPVPFLGVQCYDRPDDADVAVAGKPFQRVGIERRTTPYPAVITACPAIFLDAACVAVAAEVISGGQAGGYVAGTGHLGACKDSERAADCRTFFRRLHSLWTFLFFVKRP